jgi:WD40 repeat protein
MMGAVNAVAFLPDPSFIVFGSRRGIISLWEFDKDLKPRELYYHGQDISVIATAKSDSGASIIVSGSYDATVKIWESSSQELRIIKHKAPVSAVVFSPDSKRIASRSTDGRIIVSTVAAGTAAVKSLVIKGEDHSESAAIAFSPDGKALVLGSLDGRQSTIHVYSTETGKHIWGNVDGIASGTHYSPKSALRPQVHLAFTLSKQGSPYVILRGDNGESHAIRLVGNMFDVLSQISNASEIEPVFSVGPQPHRLTARLGPLSTKHTVFLSTAEDRPLWRTLVTSGYYAAFGHENGRITIINSESFLK